MKSLAMAVQTFPKGSDALKRHWPYFQRAGADETIIVGTTCGMCWVPDGIEQAMIGADLYIVGKHLCLRFLRTLQRLLETKSDWFCAAEYDVLFLKSIPRDLPEGLTAHFAGTKPNGCHCNEFWHGPWFMDRATADEVVRIGYEILASNIYDGSPDCFLGQIVEKGQIPTHRDILKSYSRNTIHENHPWIQEARQAITDGAICIHGIKSAEALKQVTQ